MIHLHNRLDYMALTLFLSRNKRSYPGAKNFVPREFLHCTRGLVHGAIRLFKGLGDPLLPDAMKAHASSPPSLSWWASSGAAGRRPPPRALSRAREGGFSSGPSRRAAPPTLESPTSRAIVTSISFELMEPFSESELADSSSRTRVPLSLARGASERTHIRHAATVWERLGRCSHPERVQPYLGHTVVWGPSLGA